MPIQSITYVATGARKGKTFEWRQFSFVDGLITIEAGPETQACLARSLEANLQAYPKGSAELEQALKAQESAEEPGDGQLHISGDDGSPAQSEPAGAGSDGSQGGESTQLQSPEDGAGGDDAAAGSAGGVPGGDGQQGDGSDPELGRSGEASAEGASGEADSSLSPELQAVHAAMRQLDPDDDELWTEGGLPKVAAIKSITGNEGVTRADLNAADSEFNREAAQLAKLTG